MAKESKSAKIEKRARESLQLAVKDGMPAAYLSGLNEALCIIRVVRGTCRLGRPV